MPVGVTSTNAACLKFSVMLVSHRGVSEVVEYLPVGLSRIETTPWDSLSLIQVIVGLATESSPCGEFT